MPRLSCIRLVVPVLPLLCASYCLPTPVVHADNLILQGSANGITQIRSDNVGNNYGADPALIVGKTATGGILHGLLSFDLSLIPSGATITDITLTLVSTGIGASANQGGTVAVNLHDLTGNFVEGSGNSTGVASTTTATWNRRDSSALWNTPGGDYDPTILSTLNLDPTNNPAGAVSIYASTAAFIAAAQSAFSSATPLTLLMKLNDVNEAEALRRPFFFASDDATTSTQAVKLSVTYSIPEPTVSSIAMLGFVSLLSRARRRN